jgi:nucleotide-binding universal stress UspA family protein
MKKILVAADFSEGSVEAVKSAVQIATAFEAQIILLHVLHDPADKPGFYSSKKAGRKVLRNMEEAASSMMEEFVGKHLKGWEKLEARIIPGLPAEQIVRVARREKVDLIVIGTRGHSGLKRLMIGSVTDRVIRSCTCPVLAVHAQQKTSK